MDGMERTALCCRRYYSQGMLCAKEDAKIRFDFGEGTKRRQGPVVELPATGGEWVTVDAFTMKSDVNGWRRTVLNIVAGKPDLNYFTITVEK